MHDDSKNLGKEFNERHTPNKLEFITGRYHILREIYRKFGRVSSVKRISLYLKSRTRPVKKHTSKIHSQHNSGWPPNYKKCSTEINSKAPFNHQGFISKYYKLYILGLIKINLTHFHKEITLRL